MRNLRKKERGQFTVGLALGFVTVLVIFSLIFHSGIMTREKMKLQTSADISALWAAKVQRIALDEIHDINQSIERDYLTLEAALKVSPCFTHLGGLFANAPNLISTIETLTATNFDIKDKIKEQTNTDLCDRACDKYDKMIYRAATMAYRAAQAQKSSSIMSLVTEGNKEAFKYAERAFFVFEHLPLGTQERLRKKYNGKPSADQILASYQNGSLDEIEFQPKNRDFPLFVPKQEWREAKMLTYKYQLVVDGPKVSCSPPVPSGMSFTWVPVKVAKDTDSSYLTSFLTYVKYIPKHLSKFALKLIWWGGSSEKDKLMFAKDASGKDIELIGDRMPMTAVALAKPYGGEFPEAGALTNPFDFGSPGEKFDGVRLIGIADKNAQGGELLQITPDAPSAIEDLAGGKVPLSDFTFSTKDFLH